MSNQLYHVFKTYWTRRDCLLLFTVFCLLMGLSRLAGNSMRDFLVPIAPRLASPAVNIQGNTRELVIPREEREARRIRSVNLAVPEDSPLPPLQRLPNLQRLSLKALSLSQQQTEQVLALPKLGSLELDVREIPEDFLSRLGSQLKQLELPAFQLNEHASELSSLTQLELLRIDQTGLNQETLKAIATIPHLRILVIQREPMDVPALPAAFPSAEGFPAELSLSEGDFVPLIQHPTLREVYADWGPELIRNREFLSQVHAYPFRSSVGRSPSLMLGTMAVGVISLIVLIQLSAHFLNPAATVMPRYSFPHSVVAGGVLAAGMLIAWGILKQDRFLATSLFSVLLALPCLITIMVLLSSIPKKARGISKVVELFRIALIFSCILGPQLLNSGPPWIIGTFNWYLLGHYPAVSLAILTSEIGILLIALCNSRKIGLLISQSHPERSGFSLFNWKSQQERAFQSASGNWQLKGIDAKLAHLKFHEGNFWKQVRLLQLGNPYRPAWMVALILLAGLAGIVLFGPFRGLQSLLESFAPDGMIPQIEFSPVFIPFLFQFGMVAFWIPAMVWYRRRESFEMEICRPVDREDFARQLFCAMAIDQGLAVIPILAVSLIWAWGSNSSDVRNSFLLSSPLIMAGALCLYGFSTSIFAVRRSWVLFGIGISSFLLFIVCVGGVVGFISSQHRERFFLELDAARIMAVGSAAAGIALVGIIVTWWMFLKTRNREWG